MRNIDRSLRAKLRIRKKIKRFSNRLRLSVYRSNNYIYAQIIDDQQKKTLLAVHPKEISADLKIGKGESKKMKEAFLLGEVLAKKALVKKIKKVVFDKGCYKYHGRVKALAEGARKGGLEL